jgi:hypothetical protein
MIHKCELLGGSYALFLQVAIAAFAMSSLLYKRTFLDEKPRRSFQIWSMDVSKQCFSSVAIHISNVGISILLAQLTPEERSHGGQSGDQCANYLVNFIMDTVIGIFFVWVLLSATSRVAHMYDVPSLKEQGFYDDPPSWSFYFSQLFIFLVITLFSKFLLGLLFFYFENEFSFLGRIICRPFDNDPNAELTFVMVVCPSFLNIVQVTIIQLSFNFNLQYVYVSCHSIH